MSLLRRAWPRSWNPDGRIIIYVPALNGCFGQWDRGVGHYRRYAPWRRRATLRESRLVHIQMHYMNALSLPAGGSFENER